MPTLYSAEGQRKPKLSITELVLYNMASMLAGVATGYDVRISNVSPVHPNLQPHQKPTQKFYQNDIDLDEEVSTSTADDRDYVGCSPERSYNHNTYHGPTKQSR